ncbi:MAG: arylsulfatase [Candidatus Solibacter usitatus]|nr:arylsulfatase [Candidatus Solibacter usitatus]
MLFLRSLLSLAVLSSLATAQTAKTNFIVIWGDDIGISNISAYSHGLMGYQTPNIDRLAKEGIMFTDYYGEQSCTAGRSAFMTGQSVFRTGLSKVSVPGAPLGLQKQDPTIAELLKPLGYATGQFGKNHFGDRNEFLPTVHGFDEFYGNLYHLNAEEAPEHIDYPDDPEFRKRVGPRGVLHCVATDTETPGGDTRSGPMGKQKCTDTGPLTKKRMETIDDEIAARAAQYIEKTRKSGKPMFVWVNFTHMHYRTYAKPESRGQSGKWQSEYHDVMIDHDRNVGTILKKLDELGMSEDTMVMYSTDNGPHANAWPDAATTPFRSEKNTNWEGGFRVPALVRWPGKIKPGSVTNEIVSHLDWFPTILAMAGVPNVKQTLLSSYKVGDMSYRVHLDGYDLGPFLMGKTPNSPRKEFVYFSDDGDLVALRYDNWKFVYAQQRAEGTYAVWVEPFVKTRMPLIFNLRIDPFERAQITSNTYWDWMMSRSYMREFSSKIIRDYLTTFREYPQRQRPASFTIDQMMEALQKSMGK